MLWYIRREGLFWEEFSLFFSLFVFVLYVYQITHTHVQEHEGSLHRN